MRFVLYNHVGSKNHGCEALVRTISHMLGETNTVLLSDAPEEEEKYKITEIIKVFPAISERVSVKDFIYSYLKLKFKKNYFYMDIIPYKPAIRQLNHDDVLVSIGGDIFCYDNYPKYNLLHQYALKKVKHSILVGCSIEPDLLKDNMLVKDLKSFDLISARESITYSALINSGFDNVIYCPDTAFSLPVSKSKLPDNFIPQKTVGINISPLVLKKSSDPSLILDNIRVLVNYILTNTSYAVAFIPHVVWKDNDDRIPLKKLYDEFKSTCRACLVDDRNVTELKWVISQCSYFIGARTHATIAAYSTGVPTLTLGYSVKSQGIAKDLFGTAENFVLSYKDIKSQDMLLNNFIWIMNHNDEIKNVLIEKTKIFQAEIVKIGKKFKKLYGENYD